MFPIFIYLIVARLYLLNLIQKQLISTQGIALHQSASYFTDWLLNSRKQVMTN